MPEIIKSLTFDDLPTRPPLTGRPRISDDLQQTVALLVGWDGATRRLVGVSPNGTLRVASQPIAGVINILADQANYTWQGDDISTTEVLIINHCKNTGDVWLNVGKAAAVNDGYLLECGDYVIWSLINLKSLNILIVSDTERAIVTYTQ